MAHDCHHSHGFSQRRVDNIISLRKNGATEKRKSLTLKTTFLRELSYSFHYDLFPSSSCLLHKNSMAAGIKILSVTTSI